MNPLYFTGSKINEDPKNFVEELQKVFAVMCVAGAKLVELDLYQFKDVAGYGMINGKKWQRAPPLSWDMFEDAL